MNDHISKELEKMELPEAAVDIILNLQSRAEAAEQERDKLLQLLDKIETALEPPYFPESKYAAYVSEAITAYREGSKPDATE